MVMSAIITCDCYRLIVASPKFMTHWKVFGVFLTTKTFLRKIWNPSKVTKPTYWPLFLWTQPFSRLNWHSEMWTSSHLYVNTVIFSFCAWRYHFPSWPELAGNGHYKTSTFLLFLVVKNIEAHSATMNSRKLTLFICKTPSRASVSFGTARKSTANTGSARYELSTIQCIATTILLRWRKLGFHLLFSSLECTVSEKSCSSLLLSFLLAAWCKSDNFSSDIRDLHYYASRMHFGGTCLLGTKYFTD